jgi:hypothetical protein
VDDSMMTDIARKLTDIFYGDDDYWREWLEEKTIEVADELKIPKHEGRNEEE